MDTPYFVHLPVDVTIVKPLGTSTKLPQMLTEYLVHGFDFILGQVQMFWTGTTIISLFIFIVDD